jgi:hypothetical protein
MFNKPHEDHDYSRTEVRLPMGHSHWDATKEQKEQIEMRNERLWNEEVRLLCAHILGT